MRLATFLPVAFLATAAAADLPVRQVVLYKHGVGYFERAGELRPGEDARLDFKPSEMNDVLKSLTIQDPRRRQDLRRALRFQRAAGSETGELPLRAWATAQPLSAFLDTLKGARVDVRIGPEVITGAIVGGRQTPATGQQPERELLTLLLDSGDLRTVDLSSATSLRLHDAELQGQLKEYLSAVSGARSTEKRSVYIDSTEVRPAQDHRQLRHPDAGLEVQLPPDFRRRRGGHARGLGHRGQRHRRGLDQCAAVGRLGAPGLVRQPALRAALCLPARRRNCRKNARKRRRSTRARSDGCDGARRKGQGGRGCAGIAMMARRQMAAAAPAPAFAQRADAASSVASTAEGRELGELFEYNFATAGHGAQGRVRHAALPPAEDRRPQAADLLRSPFAVPAERRRDSPTTPARRSTAGPITVYDGGAYGGEALMETLKATDKRLISYAVDLGTRITTQFDSSSNIDSRDPLPARRAHHPPGDPGNPHLHHPQRRSEAQDADHRARRPARLQVDEPETLRDHRHAPIASKSSWLPGAVEKLPVSRSGSSITPTPSPT